jgi:hypothetical protein
MKWMLLVALSSPASFFEGMITQVPMETAELCERAAAQVRGDFSTGAQLRSNGSTPPKHLDDAGVLTSCIQISN